MKIARNLLATLVLAIPLVAQAQQQPSQQPSQPAQPSQRQQGQAEAMHDIEVKGYILPAMVGIEAASVSVAVVYEMANAKPFDRVQAKNTADIAKEGIALARQRAKDLKSMKGLQSGLKPDVESAEKKLKDADKGLKDVEKEIGKMSASPNEKQSNELRSKSEKVHNQLGEARASLDKVAASYGIPTRLELQERSKTQTSK